MKDGFRHAGALVLAVIGLLAAAPAGAQDVIAEWAQVTAPPPPTLKAVTVDPKSTALLILDIQQQICGATPRCLPTVPTIQKLLARARAKQVPVLYTLGGNGTPADILKDVAPQESEPVVKAGAADKFLGTDLEKHLKDRGVQTVIVVGCRAQGAVLYTASGAAFRGMKVVVPVDGVSAEVAYAEQYTAWHLANAPRVGAQTTLTRADQIEIP